MNKKIIVSNMLAYSLSHALVDATCAATLFAIAALGQTGSQDLFYLVIFYNVLAFSTQPIFGLWVDLFKVPVYAAVAGILLVALSTLFLQFPFWAALLAGIGNALFHVGGGVISLNLDSGKAALPGIYVAPGALGLTIGILVGKGGHFIAWPFILLLIGSTLLILKAPPPEFRAPRALSGNLKWFETVILLLLLSVAVRSMVGLSLVLPWKSDMVLLFALTGAVVLGKALGGILGDRFGWTTVAVSGLIISAPLLAFFPQVPAIAILGIFLFNLSMPITLIGVAEMLPGRSGFAFGLTTLALIIGALPTFTQSRALTSNQTFIFAAVLVSIAALYGGLKLSIDHFGDRRLTQHYQPLPGEEQTRKVL
jgi:FSR family fosmidomycin resistance protein-like MFS transporter